MNASNPLSRRRFLLATAAVGGGLALGFNLPQGKAWAAAAPNAGKRSYALAAYMRAEGLRGGVPDICLPVPRGPYAALYIEMKSRRGVASPAQQQWLQGLTALGNRAVLCYGCDAAWAEIMAYLALPQRAQVA